jgi:hypothetical protein
MPDVPVIDTSTLYGWMETGKAVSILDKLPSPPANHLAILERNLSGSISDANPVDLEAGANGCTIS